MIEISQDQIEEAKARIYGYIETCSSRPRREWHLWEAKVHCEAKALLLLGLLTQDEVTDMHFALEQVKDDMPMEIAHALYSLHYRYEEVIGPGSFEHLIADQGQKNIESHTRHARISCQFDGGIEYDSDLRLIEQWLAEQHRNSPFHMNFQVLSWQPLVGEQRPAETQGKQDDC